MKSILRNSLILIFLAINISGCIQNTKPIKQENRNEAPGQVPHNLESKLPKPPNGFIWQLYKDATFIVPEVWVKREKTSYENGFPIYVYAASPTEFSETNFFEMGITLQIIKDSKKVKNIEAKMAALLFLKPFFEERKKEDVLMFSTDTEGDFEKIYFRYRDAPERLTPIIVHKFVMINNTSDSVHIFTFESPEKTWTSNWETFGAPIIKRVMLIATYQHKKY